jgi:hypothetical protein
VLTGQWGDYGLPPAESSFGIHAIVTHHYFEGGFYPVGGARAIAAAIVPRIESLKGAVVVDAEVTRLLVERGRVVGVQLAGGREFRAPIVVSDAGLRRTLALLPDAVPGRTVLDRLAGRVAPSAAHACLYVGLSRDDAELGLEKRNLWVYQDEAHESALARFASDPDQPFPLAFLSFPSAKDPTFGPRYPGRATIEVVTLARYEWFEGWAAEPWRRRSEPYTELKARLTERLLEVLYREVPSVSRTRRGCRAVDPSQHPPLRRVRSGRDLRAGPHPVAVRRTGAQAGDSGDGIVAHRSGRDHMRRGRRPYGRVPDGFGHRGPAGVPAGMTRGASVRLRPSCHSTLRSGASFGRVMSHECTRSTPASFRASDDHPLSRQRPTRRLGDDRR